MTIASTALKWLSVKIPERCRLNLEKRLNNIKSDRNEYMDQDSRFIDASSVLYGI